MRDRWWVCGWRTMLGWLAAFWLSGLVSAGAATAQLGAGGAWTPTGSLSAGPRSEHTATLLLTGQVLVAGGRGSNPEEPEFPLVVNSAEIYDPATGRFTPTASLTHARINHTATLLPTGQVLVVGGCCDSTGTSAELYDPATGHWTATGSLTHGRNSHTATLLYTGQVLVVGGSEAFTSAELYDPATGRWVPSGSLTNGRAFHTATLLPTGQVLVAGGDAFGSAELYDLETGKWTVTGSLATNRDRHTATLLPTGQVLAVGGYSEGTLGSAERYDPGTGKWTPAGQLTDIRTQHTATLLPSGQVLVAGGCGLELGCGDQDFNFSVGSSELYDPAHGTWTNAGTLAQSRGLHTATLLPDGRMLVVGGCCDGINPWNILASAELLTPSLPRFAATGSLGTGRDSHTATLLPSGRVLVAGGVTTVPLDTAESYDPTSGRWSPTGTLVVARESHSATRLSTGQVLVVGGLGPDLLDSTETYDPETGAWRLGGQLTGPRAHHTATLLPSGQVLVAGGGNLGIAEVSDPEGSSWIVTGRLNTNRSFHTATLLLSGRVLVAGGLGAASTSAELYDPGTGKWTVTGSLVPGRASHTATLLPSGQVLVAGGRDPNSDLVARATLYDPTTSQWTDTGAMVTPRASHAATLLPSGQVLVTGGEDGDVPTASAELYDPATGRWSDAGVLATARQSHTATFLHTGQVLAAGGRSPGDTASAELFDPGLGFDETWRPSVTAVSPVAVGAAVGLVGSFFQGLSEASGGSGSQNSASNYPFVQLRRLDSEQTRFLSVDPVAGWSDESFTSLPLVDFPAGPALLTVVTNGIPSLAQPVVVTSATLACPPPGCEHPRANLRLGPVRVSPHRVPLGQSVEVTATLRAGTAPVFDLIVRLYDGDPENGGDAVHSERIPHLPARGAVELRMPFTPVACGNDRLVVVAGPGTPIEDRRASTPFHVDCRGRGRR